IDQFLNNHDYTSALLLSAIYAHIRLKSLLADKLAPHNIGNRKVAFKDLMDMRLDFYPAIQLCKASGIISPKQHADLQSLNSKRNDVAHESKLWRTMEPVDVSQIEGLCSRAKSFLQETSEAK